MSKTSVQYVCQNCGSAYSKWKGRCDGCGSWNTLVTETIEKKPAAVAPVALETLSQTGEREFPRIRVGIEEFDRVCGGGIVAGSVSLVAGDPGIGKSTLLLQIASLLSQKIPVLYVSGEESATQIRLRAKRLGLSEAPVHLLSHHTLEGVLQAIPKVLSSASNTVPAFVIIDSIQTMVSQEVGGAAGTLSQIRECLQHLITLAKTTGIALMVVGHITKEGMIAGPKVLEHMVDTVLYFEGEKAHAYRLLRTIKNRFGPTDEVGVFDMTDQGLREVANPSALFLSHRQKEVSGACIFAGMEGTRPLLIEIQALATPSFLASPRRSVVGWDTNRLSMVLAVLEARYNMAFSNKDIFLSVLGGLRITEPAADLAVAIALVSCLKKRPIPRDLLAFGEIGLTGEITPISHTDQRLKEAEKLGFAQVCMPQRGKYSTSLAIHGMNHVKDLDILFH